MAAASPHRLGLPCISTPHLVLWAWRVVERRAGEVKVEVRLQSPGKEFWTLAWVYFECREESLSGPSF